MADINSIEKANLPDQAKSFLKLTNTDNEMASDSDDQYLFRILIDKINELVAEVNTLKNK